MRLLRLRHLRPRGWQRALLVDGTLVGTLLLVLADLVSAWGLLVLPAAVALVVKGHDVVAGQLATSGACPRPPAGTGPHPPGTRP